MAELFVAKCKAALGVFAEDVLGKCFYKCVIESLGGAELLLDALVFLDAAGDTGEAAAEFELRADLPGERAQGLLLPGSQLARFGVEHGERAKRKPFRANNLHCGAELNAWLALDQGVGGKAGIASGVRDQEQLRFENCMTAK